MIHTYFRLGLHDPTSRALTDHIGLLRAAYARGLQERPFQTLAITVLPNELHALWALPNADPELPLRVGRLKSRFGHALVSATGQRDDRLWRKGIAEHRIRDEADLNLHLRYVAEAPMRAGLVQNPLDWPYSSFTKRAGQKAQPPEQSQEQSQAA
jgi:putative transposase